MEDKKILLSVKDLHVKFKVRGRTLSAIRGISLDFYENESVAIVGESGSGKSVFTKTFAGMLDSNGYIDEGSIMFNDPELSDTKVYLKGLDKSLIKSACNALNRYAALEHGAEVFKAMEAMKAEKEAKESLSEEEDEALTDTLAQLRFERTELFNAKQTLDPKKEKHQIKEAAAKLKEMDKQIEDLEKKRNATIKARKAAARQDTEYLKQYNAKMQVVRHISVEIGKGLRRDEVIANDHIFCGTEHHSKDVHHYYAYQVE
jgi:oligopeptide transport system ATP-binding protein